MEISNNILTFESMPDEKLLLLCRQGSVEAEEMLIRRYGRIIRSLARPYFLTGGDSEDLIQEGMLGLLNAIRRFDPQEETSFKTFAVLCIRRRLISVLRKAAGTKNVSLDDCLSFKRDTTICFCFCRRMNNRFCAVSSEECHTEKSQRSPSDRKKRWTMPFSGSAANSRIYPKAISAQADANTGQWPRLVKSED